MELRTQSARPIHQRVDLGVVPRHGNPRARKRMANLFADRNQVAGMSSNRRVDPQMWRVQAEFPGHDHGHSRTVYLGASDIHPHPGIASNTTGARAFLPKSRTSHSHTAGTPKVPAVGKAFWCVAGKSVGSCGAVLEPRQTPIHRPVRVRSPRSTHSVDAHGSESLDAANGFAAAETECSAVAVVDQFCHSKPFFGKPDCAAYAISFVAASPPSCCGWESVVDSIAEP